MKNKIKLIAIIFCLLIPFISFGDEEIGVQGIVLSKSDNTPLVGAIVVIKGTTVGTATDSEGKFSISASSGRILIVSYVGFETQTFVIHDNSFITVALNEIHSQLDEVVVTALGISKEKKSLGYAVQEIKTESITTAPESNLSLIHISEPTRPY